uniref:Uncharacterized protein n=1 Tax=Grateloupia filicina TaxID=31455 RepID=A0A2S1FXK1_9FLOR|nr:hypothetical protein Grafi_p076 [Grateloupia filicina]AWD77480.1 hypothetical protein Grafi_p076 [Grateloupia filicina]
MLYTLLNFHKHAFNAIQNNKMYKESKESCNLIL